MMIAAVVLVGLRAACRVTRSQAQMRASIPILLVASVSSVACVAPFDAPNLTPLAEEVRVYLSRAEIPQGCKSLGTLSVVDGNTESSKGYMYQGTRDRAVIRLRNESAARGGNAVVIEDEGDVLVFDGPEVGKYYINGQALQCSGVVRPNTRVSPPGAQVPLNVERPAAVTARI